MRTIEGIFVEILSIMCMGEGRLDFVNIGRDYTLVEAKEAFDRVAKQHKWI